MVVFVKKNGFKEAAVINILMNEVSERCKQRWNLWWKEYAETLYFADETRNNAYWIENSNENVSAFNMSYIFFFKAQILVDLTQQKCIFHQGSRVGNCC